MNLTLYCCASRINSSFCSIALNNLKRRSSCYLRHDGHHCCELSSYLVAARRKRPDAALLNNSRPFTSPLYCRFYSTTTSSNCSGNYY